jgi:hypothetical protein
MPAAEAGASASGVGATAARLPAPVAAAALGTGSVGAILVAGAPAGLALSLCAELAIATGAVATDGWRRDRWARAMLIAAAALALAPLVRDAGWIVAGDLVVALVLAAIALGRSRDALAVLAAPVDLIGPMLFAPAAAARGALGSLDGRAWGLAAPAVRAAALTGALLLVFGALFASADGAFAQLAGDLIPEPPALGSLPARIAIGVLALCCAGGLAMIVGRERTATAPPGNTLAPLELGLGLVALVGLFGAFVAVQFVVLFGGRAHVLQSAGLTYADYAHQGFVQLLAVAALALAVIAAARRWARVDSRARELLLRVLLVAIAALTLVIVISALHRLDLYVDEFGATRLRLAAAGACAWIGAMLGFAILAIASGHAGWLARAVVASVAAAAIAFTVADPDSLIARRNVDRYLDTGRIDVAYNASLSADAVGQLSRLPEPVAGRVLAGERSRLIGRDGVRGFNLARASARDSLGLESAD